MLPLPVLGLTLLAMLAFAANSVLCRLALADGAIDAGSFSSLRLLAGALFLLALSRWQQVPLRAPVDRRMVLSLLVYVVFFSWAYLSLSVATGALLLFSFVQLTMIGAGLYAGERYAPLAWTGIVLAMAGLVCLLLPGVRAPDPVGAAMMALAGVAWGVYSLLGRASRSPLATTTRNFAFAAPIALLLSLLTADQASATVEGVIYAVLSGALASGAGYAIWYRALAGLNGSQAASVQLTVPVIAALGGWLLAGEPLTMRLVVSTALTLGGVALVLHTRQRALS